MRSLSPQAPFVFAGAARSQFITAAAAVVWRVFAQKQSPRALLLAQQAPILHSSRLR
jgi:hypothetical protein